MGKIVKYCVSCDEGFAEKFGFCPTCGSQLQSFEMKPVAADAPAEIAEPPVPPVIEDAIQAEPPVTVQFEEKASPVESFDETPEAFTESFSEPVVEADEVHAAADESDLNDVVEVQAAETLAAPAAANYAAETFSEPAYSNPDRSYNKQDDGYYVTVIQEKNAKQRNILLLGSMIFIVSLAFSGTVYSLFHKDLQVGAIDGGDLFAFVPVVEESPMETEEEQKKNKEEGGGGGGGGRDEKDPTSQGRLASQTLHPDLAPDKSAHQMDSELKQIASTQGTKIIQPTLGPYGDPNSKYYISSNGQGTGGGQGSGVGTGQGSGRGTGQGSGVGSGSGSGEGDGDGDGRGPGSGSAGAPPPPAAMGPTVGVKILSKPRPSYTDAARQNNIQGSVTLRITFLANGQIGSISPVSGLPYGLTEQAMVAARSIRFEPAKRGGVPIAKTMTVQYGFAIY